jgi:predicted O-methyltransferase YrrM
VRVAELAKFVVYRTPLVSRLMAPSYPYKLDPAELSTMIALIDATRGTGAAIAEVGVAQGDSSVFLLEHLRTTRDERPLLLFDTFSGFTEESVEAEVSARGRARREYDAFRYGDEQRFRRNLAKAGYSNFETISGDAAAFDWQSIAPIAAVLLDVDLYQPSIHILNAVYPLLVPGGGIVVDDCVPVPPWDGALQAYEEFVRSHDLPFERVGHKGALIRSPF